MYLYTFLKVAILPIHILSIQPSKNQAGVSEIFTSYMNGKTERNIFISPTFLPYIGFSPFIYNFFAIQVY